MHNNFFKNLLPKKSNKIEYFDVDRNFILNELQQYFWRINDPNYSIEIINYAINTNIYNQIIEIRIEFKNKIFYLNPKKEWWKEIIDIIDEFNTRLLRTKE